MYIRKRLHADLCILSVLAVYANMATLGLPKNIEALANEGSVKLFGKWETADVDVSTAHF